MIQTAELGSCVDAPLKTPSQCALENDPLVEFSVNLRDGRCRLLSAETETLEFPQRATSPAHLHVRRTVGIGDRRAMVVQCPLAPQSPQDRLDLGIAKPFPLESILYLLGTQLTTRQHGQRCEVRIRWRVSLHE